MREHEKKGSKASSAEDEPAGAQHVDPRAAKWAAIVKGATTFNQQHPELVAEFNKATNGKCSGSNAGLSVRAVREWQMERGLQPDGKIGKKVLEAARAEGKKGGEQSDVTFSDQEAGSVGAAGAESDTAKDAVAGGDTEGQETIADKGDASQEGNTIAADGAQKVGEDIAPDIAGGELSGSAKLGIGAAARLTLVPEIVSKLKHHDFKGALSVIWKSVGHEERVEVVKAIAEKLAGELSEHALLWFERAALAGAVVDVLALGWEWTRLGLESVYEAHEKGDQKARVRIYAFAWSDTILRGEHSAAGAVTPEEKEAAERGAEDGRATRLRQPELPFLLLAQYGSERAAREALELELMRKAGDR